MPFDCTPIIDASRSSVAPSHDGSAAALNQRKWRGSLRDQSLLGMPAAGRSVSGIRSPYSDGLASFSSMNEAGVSDRSLVAGWISPSLLTPHSRAAIALWVPSCTPAGSSACRSRRRPRHLNGKRSGRSRIGTMIPGARTPR